MASASPVLPAVSPHAVIGPVSGSAAICTDLICHVGGGTGTPAARPTRCRSRRRGTVFDLAVVVSGAARSSVIPPPERWSAVAGSFFDPAPSPSGHDRYVMQAIMHDWPDQQAGIILRNVGRPCHPTAGCG